MLVIETIEISKRFRSATIIDGLNIRMTEGSIYGFVGINGAGKTTTIKMLLGLLRPSAGQIRIFGKDLGREKTDILGQVGALVETPGMYGNLTGRENLCFLARVLAVPMSRVDAVLRTVGLVNDADKKARKYSLGTKQRLGIGMALLHEPRLLILDEPTNGLDPVGIVEMREFLRALSINRGVSIFVSSHLLSEINLLATDVGILHQGIFVYQGPLSRLQNQYPEKTLEEIFVKYIQSAPVKPIKG